MTERLPGADSRTEVSEQARVIKRPRGLEGITTKDSIVDLEPDVIRQMLGKLSLILRPSQRNPDLPIPTKEIVSSRYWRIEPEAIEGLQGSRIRVFERGFSVLSRTGNKLGNRGIGVAQVTNEDGCSYVAEEHYPHHLSRIFYYLLPAHGQLRVFEEIGASGEQTVLWEDHEYNRQIGESDVFRFTDMLETVRQAKRGFNRFNQGMRGVFLKHPLFEN